MLFPQSSTEMITLMSRDPTILGKIHAVYHQVLKQFDNNPYTLIENITVKCEVGIPTLAYSENQKTGV